MEDKKVTWFFPMVLLCVGAIVCNLELLTPVIVEWQYFSFSRYGFYELLMLVCSVAGTALLVSSLVQLIRLRKSDLQIGTKLLFLGGLVSMATIVGVAAIDGAYSTIGYFFHSAPFLMAMIAAIKVPAGKTESLEPMRWALIMMLILGVVYIFNLLFFSGVSATLYPVLFAARMISGIIFAILLLGCLAMGDDSASIWAGAALVAAGIYFLFEMLVCYYFESYYYDSNGLLSQALNLFVFIAIMYSAVEILGRMKEIRVNA